MKKFRSFLIALAIILIDQIIKMLVSIKIPYGEAIGKGIRITNVANTGMAYSMRKKQSNNYSNCKYSNNRDINIFVYKKL